MTHPLSGTASVEMTANQSPSLWRRVRKTPMRDVIRGRMTGRLDIEGALMRSGLREDVQKVIRQTVRKCRLWRLERADLARELIQHFQDAAEAGIDPVDAAKQFGDTATAAKLIRRATRRKRPAPWQMMRLAVKGLAWTIALAVLVYGIQAARVFLTEPAVSVDYRIALNEKARAVPEEERAWPAYREALIGLPRGLILMEHFNRPPRPNEDGWVETVQYLDEHAANIAAARRIRNYGGLGFVVGYAFDEADRELWPEIADYDESQYQDGGMIGILMPYLADMQRLGRVLSIDAVRQAVDGNGNILMEDIESLIAISRHSRELPILISDLVGHAIAVMAFETIGELLADYPDVFTDNDLLTLAHQLAALDDKSLQIDLRGERMMFADIIQRSYSDDGNGNGFLTAEGLKLFESFSNFKSGIRGSGGWPDQWIGISAPVISAIVIDRKKAMREYNRYMDKVATISSQPAWTRDFGDADAQIAEWSVNPSSRIRNLPLATLLPAITKVGWQVDRTAMHRDAVLIVLAAELFKRRTGEWPESLDELVPKFLPAAPIDRMTGEPIRYVIRDGRPLVYSVGGDREDDGGTRGKPWSYYETMPFQPHPAIAESERDVIMDWILWPPSLDELERRDVE